MSLRRFLAVLGLLWLPGCLYQVKEQTDRVVCDLSMRSYDVQPAAAPSPSPGVPAGKAEAGAHAATPGPATDVNTSSLIEVGPTSGIGDQESTIANASGSDLVQADKEKDTALEAIRRRLEKLKIPEAVPGSEAPPIYIPKEPPAAKAAAIRKLYPPLPALPEETKALLGPNGQPYSLAELQQMAAANSATLRQAASDILAAQGNLIQAGAYPNPTVALQAQPSNDGSTPSVWGGSVDQVVKSFGKIKLARAAAEMDLRNAELALRRARSDLATAVRNAYFAVLVAQETVRVTQALARFTDEVYLAQADVLQGGFAAPYEPAALRAQAWTVRLALKQAITTHYGAWNQLVSTIGLRHLPLSQVAGRIDRAIPYYDYDAVLAYALNNHTDVLTARNTVDKARYNLKLAQITPYPDVDFSVGVLKEFALAPFQVTPSMSVSVPLPVWDQNRGNIIAAEAALVRASDEPHRVEVALTNNLTAAYTNYKNNVDALEYYRKYILPDQVRTYRGVFERRRLDPSLGFVDLVSAQQSLVSNVTGYLGVLGTLWTSVVSVADFLQTDDLFQLAKPQGLPALPNLEALPPWLCEHPCATGTHAGAGPGTSGTVQPAPDAPVLPAPLPVEPQRSSAEAPLTLPPLSLPPSCRVWPRAGS
jgi:cobalt-zinc-cadmium efflux system outer membrane protein